jgi:hypothetical protein
MDDLSLGLHELIDELVAGSRGVLGAVLMEPVLL